MAPDSMLSARWLLSIHRPPVEGGWVEIADGRIVRTGQSPPPRQARDLGDVALLPGLVNAHTHLELSWLAGRVEPAASLVEWIRASLAIRAAGPPGGPAAAHDAVRHAIAAMKDTGTVLVGDVANGLDHLRVLAASGLGGVVCHELLGFNRPHPEVLVKEAWARLDRELAASGKTDLVGSVVAHAPYSVSPALFGEIARARRSAPVATHVGESAEELEFLRTGRGPFRALLEDLGAWDEGWQAPGCDPVEYLGRTGYLVPGLLAVHAVHLTDAALERLRAAGGVVVTCPRSNTWVGGGLPRIAHFYSAAVPVAIGTDSLASAPSLNMFDELAELRRIAPDVSAGCLLESATRVGAEALGFGGSHGTIEPGKRAALVAVEIPARVADVEEYLVSGVPRSAIHPVHL